MPTSPSVSFALIVLATGLAACTDPTGPAVESLAADDNPSFTTDKAAYVAVKVQEPPFVRYTFQLVARFTNTTDKPVYLARCYPNTTSPIFGIQLLGVPDASRSGYDPAWACVGHDEQIEVLPGATRTDTFEIGGPNAFDGITNKPFGELTGTMRLVYAVQACRGDGACQLTGSIGLSTPFTVTTN